MVHCKIPHECHSLAQDDNKKVIQMEVLDSYPYDSDVQKQAREHYCKIHP